MLDQLLTNLYKRNNNLLKKIRGLSKSKAKPFLFYFTFCYQDEYGFDRELTKSFVVNQRGMHNLLKGEYVKRAEEYQKSHKYDDRCSPFNEFNADYYDRYCAEIEDECGVHNILSSPVDVIDSMGYISYEIAEKNIDECINRHRSVFAALCGDKFVSPIVDIKDKSIFTDSDKYDMTIKKLGDHWK